jgi:hypothetical protein
MRIALTAAMAVALTLTAGQAAFAQTHPATKASSHDMPSHFTSLADIPFPEGYPLLGCFLDGTQGLLWVGNRRRSQPKTSCA